MSAFRVLVVDDDEGNRYFAARIFSEAGCEVVSALDGPDALHAVRTQGLFDLFVIDERMPLMLGDELARRIRGIDPDAKILFFTGHIDTLFEQHPILGAYEAYVEKPVTIKGLLEAASLLLFGSTHGLCLSE